MQVTLIDSPVANVANIARALRAAGADLHITRDALTIAAARKIVLPGVGSFAAAMRWLEEMKIDQALRDAVSRGSSLLGICVGHQALFDVSYEMGTTRGLGLVRGEIRKFEGNLPVPQIGWNRVSFRGGEAPDGHRAASNPPRDVEVAGGPSPAAGPGMTDPHSTGLFAGIPSGTSFYFVNSYAASGVDAEIARADYGGSFTAAVQDGRVHGVQFHPEKSSSAGLQVLRNYVETL